MKHNLGLGGFKDNNTLTSLTLKSIPSYYSKEDEISPVPTIESADDTHSPHSKQFPNDLGSHSDRDRYPDDQDRPDVANKSESLRLHDPEDLESSEDRRNSQHVKLETPFSPNTGRRMLMESLKIIKENVTGMDSSNIASFNCEECELEVGIIDYALVLGKCFRFVDQIEIYCCFIPILHKIRSIFALYHATNSYISR
jgi:hypothetical protein